MLSDSEKKTPPDFVFDLSSVNTQRSTETEPIPSQWRTPALSLVLMQLMKVESLIEIKQLVV
jgi:hypothetical protein